jgi:hypothetical protein
VAVSAEISIGSNGDRRAGSAGPVHAMTRAYYPTVIQQSTLNVWKITCDFNNYPVWIDGPGECGIEDGKSGDTIGAIKIGLFRHRHPAKAAGAFQHREDGSGPEGESLTNCGDIGAFSPRHDAI